MLEEAVRVLLEQLDTPVHVCFPRPSFAIHPQPGYARMEKWFFIRSLLLCPICHKHCACFSPTPIIHGSSLPKYGRLELGRVQEKLWGASRRC